MVTTTETLASYEAISPHDIAREAKCPVVQVIFPFKGDAAAEKLAGMKRRDAHYAISKA